MKTYTFTTYNLLNEEVETYKVEAFSIKEARVIARNVVGNSRDNEVRHGRVTLVK